MAVTILVGTQWGDEGKGKLIDVLTENIDMVVRFQGGNNAGHTVKIGDEKYVLHLVPSGIFRKDIINVIGNGLVVDPASLMEEMQGLADRNIDISNIQLSSKAHLVLPYHNLMDGLNETNRVENEKIGTTKRGIGPAYSDKASRCGIRAHEMLDLLSFKKRFVKEAEKYNIIFSEANVERLDIENAWVKLEETAKFLAPFINDTVYTVNAAAKANKNILFEGAQGALLDIDHGTYPFVTSSTTTTGGASGGTGLSPKYIDTIYGVIKAYTTRVGEGPFPTELFDATGAKIAKVGGEFGATTGRPRRCGWFDAVAGAYSCMVNGIDKLAITKLDVLDNIPEIKICTAYEINGEKTTQLPPDSQVLSEINPVYETMPGWMESTEEVREFKNLPENAKKYLKRMAELVDADIGIISVGPKREQTFYY